MEHDNLAANPEYEEVIERFKRYLPTHHEPDGPKKSGQRAEIKGSKKGREKEKERER